MNESPHAGRPCHLVSREDWTQEKQVLSIGTTTVAHRDIVRCESYANSRGMRGKVPELNPLWRPTEMSTPPWSSLALRRPTDHGLDTWTLRPLPAYSGIDARHCFRAWATITVGGLGNKAVRVT